ncbi:unnamed protein product [Moneuplotes crassus]|uniref:Cyclin-like domain-containing protein n=1 Tax=Euplotes crassus TaxID=5936 RepID=A0AAD1U5N6_EUPCR|nr:unnamed protein product [Moneuplotes crassus]
MERRRKSDGSSPKQSLVQKDKYRLCCKSKKNIIKIQGEPQADTKKCMSYLKMCTFCSTVHLRRIDPQNPEKVLTKSCFAKKEIEYKQHVDLDINPVEYYKIMLKDEKLKPQMRIFNPNVMFDNLPDVYCYYFYDCKSVIQQRMQTLHLAMNYYTQCYTKMCMMDTREIELRYPRICHFVRAKSDIAHILVPACLLLASKFDEIDYNLPSFNYLRSSQKLSQFWVGFQWADYVEFERTVIDLLNWNCDQMTPYHFLQTLISQGILLSHERVRKENSPQSPMSKLTCNGSLTIRHPYGGRSKSVRRTPANQSFATVSNEISLNKIKSGEKEEISSSQKEETIAVDIETCKMVRETAEYYCQMTTLIPEMQKYDASLVAICCVLAARKACRIEPLFSKEIENLFRFSEYSATLTTDSKILQDCLNLLLLNQTSLNICGEILTESILGKIPSGSQDTTPQKQGTHWASTEKDVVIPLNNSEIFTPNKIAAIEGRKPVKIELEAQQIILDAPCSDLSIQDQSYNLEQFKEPASYDDIFAIDERKSEMRLDIAEDPNQTQEKRKTRRNHLNNIDEMMERIDHLRVQKDQSNLRLKRAASYTRLRSSYPKSKSMMKRQNAAGTRNAYADSRVEDRIRSISPDKVYPQTNPSQGNIVSRISDHKQKYEGKIMKVFELKKASSIKTADQSPPFNMADARKEYETTVENSSSGLHRMRSLRYKSIVKESSCDDLKKTQIMRKESDNSGKTTTSEGSNTYYSNYNVTTGSEYYQRRKQPRQAKKYLDLPKENPTHQERDPESEDEADIIANEEIKEHASQESPFRQQVHETKSKLNLKNIKFEEEFLAEAKTPDMAIMGKEKSGKSEFQELVTAGTRSDSKQATGHISHHYLQPEIQVSHLNSIIPNLPSCTGSIRSFPKESTKFTSSGTKSEFSKTDSVIERKSLLQKNNPRHSLQPTTEEVVDSRQLNYGFAKPSPAEMSTKPLALRKRSRKPYDLYSQGLYEDTCQSEDYPKDGQWMFSTGNRNPRTFQQEGYQRTTRRDLGYNNEGYRYDEGYDALGEISRVRSQRYYERDNDAKRHKDYISPNPRLIPDFSEAKPNSPRDYYNLNIPARVRDYPEYEKPPAVGQYERKNTYERERDYRNIYWRK